MNLGATETKYGLIEAANFKANLKKSWSEKNGIEMYSTHNGVKPVLVKELLEP